MVPQNEKERLEALKAYQILDTKNEEQFDRLTKLASLICNTPIALVSLIDEQRQWFKSAVGLDVPHTAREISFCQHAIMGDDLFEVQSTKNDQRFINNPLVTGAPDIRFYAGYPLKDPSGYNLGTLCVIDTQPKKLSSEQKLALELLAKEVVSQMVARINNIELLKLKKLFELSLDLICVAGTDGFLKNINPAFVNTLGWTKEELLSKPFLEIIHPEDREKTALEIDSFKKGEHTAQFEARFLKKNGQYIWLSWIAKADISQGEAFAIARDVTENKQQVTELILAKNLAESATKVKEEFLSNMSHEIRTPLNAIIGFNELLAQSELNEGQKKQVDIISIASKNLIGILNDILDTSKLESGNIKLDESPLSIKNTIENAIELQRADAKAKNIKLLMVIDQDLPQYIMADGNRINQILLNLINNGIKFTKKGYVEVKVIEMARNDNQSTIRFVVKDTGIGIPDNKKDSIFERFTQAENSTTRKYGGTGLGMYIVKSLVQLHNGTIELNSILDKGTEINIDISFEISPNAAEKAIGKVVDKPVIAPIEAPKTLKGIRILVVEDNEHNQILARTFLEKNQAIVDIAEDGLIAVEKVKNNAYDIILMDLQMPNMDGLQATKIIREELKLVIPIIACSAHSMAGVKENCLSNGLNDYILKPYKEKTIINVLSLFVNSPQESTTPSPEPVKTVEYDDIPAILDDLSDENGVEFTQMMVDIFVKRIPNDITDVETALAENDAAKLKSKAHLLAGSLGCLNFNKGLKISKEIEISIQQNSLIAALEKGNDFVDYLQQTLIEVINYHKNNGF